jgi:peptidoglycan hydrolase CwlO-like protein
MPWLSRIATQISGTVLTKIYVELIALNHRLDKLMASVADLSAELDTVKADLAALISGVGTEVGSLQSQIAALQAQIASGTGITAAQLDPVLASAQAIDAQIKAATPAPATHAAP